MQLRSRPIPSGDESFFVTLPLLVPSAESLGLELQTQRLQLQTSHDSPLDFARIFATNRPRSEHPHRTCRRGVGIRFQEDARPRGGSFGAAGVWLVAFARRFASAVRDGFAGAVTL